VLLAGEAAFDRGVEYFRQGHVLGWNKQGDTITAEVEGNKCYHVTLSLTHPRPGQPWAGGDESDRGRLSLSLRASSGTPGMEAIVIAVDRRVEASRGVPRRRTRRDTSPAC
jgi:hypothetical protein